jgi:hypothetical protein
LSIFSFASREIAYLSYVIGASGVSTCPDKVKAMVEWLIPKNVKELRSFHGLASYCPTFWCYFKAHDLFVKEEFIVHLDNR